VNGRFKENILSILVDGNLTFDVVLDEPIPIILALIMGLQHAFAMVGGLITPPLVVFKVSDLCDVLSKNIFWSLGIIC
jgi:xanthine/uracil permease